MRSLFDIPDIKRPVKYKQKEYVNAEMIINRFMGFKFNFPLVLIASSLAGCIECVCVNHLTQSRIIKKEAEIIKMAKDWYGMPDEAIILFIKLFQEHRTDLELAGQLRKYYENNANEDEVRKYLIKYRKDGKYG